MILEKINSPRDIKKLTIKELEILAQEIREFLLEKVSKTGGHLASNLGVVELTLAVHYIFDAPKDKIIWDVSHQIYVHKLITGRKNKFDTLRQYKGISGFSKPSESKYDTYIAGHSSTSLSLAAGTIVARDLARKKYDVVAIIGDGALTGGIALEGLNNLGQLQKDVIVILNTNEMSISANVGALSHYLNKIITGSVYNTLKRRLYSILRKFPSISEPLVKIKNKITEALKAVIVPGILFEEFGFMYVGPENGHDLKRLISTLKRLKKIKSRPILYHIITQKGKGYKPAEEKPEKFHGVSSFEIDTGKFLKNKKHLSYTEVFSKTLVNIAKKDKKIVAITAAMPEGTGLDFFGKEFPDRFFDVGIAEQHAVTFAAALAKNNFKPAVAIYSTFLQRALDQVIHDVCIDSIPVKFFIDRAGIVGEDGETHQGVFDISYLRMIPNTVILAPKNGYEFQNMIYTAFQYNKGPIFIRYPRYTIPEFEIEFNRKFKNIKIGGFEILQEGKNIAIIANGIMVSNAIEATKKIKKSRYKPMIINLYSIKPINEKRLIDTLKGVKKIIIAEENTIFGGTGEMLLNIFNKYGLCKDIRLIGVPDKFIEHGNPDLLRDIYNLNVDTIYKNIIE